MLSEWVEFHHSLAARNKFQIHVDNFQKFFVNYYKLQQTFIDIPFLGKLNSSKMVKLKLKIP